MATKPGNDRPSLEPGLGRDEPSEQMARRAKSNGERRMEELRAEVTTATEALEKKEQILADRETRLAAREAAIVAAEKKAKAGSS